MIRVLIADDHTIVREGLKRILRESLSVEVSEAKNGREVLLKTGKKNFDLILLDIAMPDINGLEVLRQLKHKHPALPVLMLTIFPEEQYAVQGLKAGASGYLTKDSAADELIHAIRKIMNGGTYVSESLGQILAGRLTRVQGTLPHEQLSRREYEVLCFIALGKRIKDMAGQLSVSEKTISTYRYRLLEKMNMSSNAELTRYVLEHQLLDTLKKPGNDKELPERPVPGKLVK